MVDSAAAFSWPMRIFLTMSPSLPMVPPAKIYAADYAVPTPTDLTTAVSAMQTAYTDAAGRSSPDHLNLVSGEWPSESLLAVFGR